MEKAALTDWQVLTFKGASVTRKLVNLRLALFNGQAFTWQRSEEPEAYWGVCKGNYFEFRYNPRDELEFRSTDRLYRGDVAPEQAIIDYFNLSLDYDEIFKDLLAQNAHFKAAYAKAAGLRVLRQDPWECMIGFICSQNNNIKRISQMVQSLCADLGERLVDCERGQFRSFPTPAQVAASNKERLSRLGFGYRAKYMVKAAQELLEKGGVDYLHGLRSNPNPKLLAEAMQSFTGVGPKVADCVSLFALDGYSLVPMDTHMFQLCEKLYKKKFTKYDAARAFLQDKLGGKFAGIAHTFLFTFEIHEFKQKPAPLKPDPLTQEEAPKANSTKPASRVSAPAGNREALKSAIGPAHGEDDGLTRMQLRKPKSLT